MDEDKFLKNGHSPKKAKERCIFFKCIKNEEGISLNPELQYPPDGMMPLDQIPVQENDERIFRPFGFGFRPFGRPFFGRPFFGRPFFGRPFFGRPFFGGPFLGGLAGGLLGAALLSPSFYGNPYYGYPYYPNYW
jgi:hypothetical protein